MSTPEDRSELIGRYVDGTATGEQMRELEAALKADQRLRREFLSYLHLDAALACAPVARFSPRVSQEHSSGTSAAPAQNHAARSAPFSWWWRCAAALVLCLGCLVWFIPSDGALRGEAAVPFAVLAAARETVWSDPNVEMALRSGEMPTDRLDLESGSAEFVCADGASVILNGPAALRFVGRRKVFLHAGRALFRCPTRASRLTVETSGTEIVDLGTEFTVEILPNQETRVHVLEGEVSVGKKSPHRLGAGEAARVLNNGLLSVPPVLTDTFAELLPLSLDTEQTAHPAEANLLRDPGFESGLPAENWSGTERYLESAARGRSGNGLRILAGRNVHWPLCRQTLETGDIGGRLVTASVWAAVAPGDPLASRQHALLKIAFKNTEGRDFAFAVKRFAGPGDEPGRFVHAQISAIAPQGTQRVQFQLLVHSDLREHGSVVFDDAYLAISAPRTKAR